MNEANARAGRVISHRRPERDTRPEGHDDRIEREQARVAAELVAHADEERLEELVDLSRRALAQRRKAALRKLERRGLETVGMAEVRLEIAEIEVALAQHGLRESEYHLTAREAVLTQARRVLAESREAKR